MEYTVLLAGRLRAEVDFAHQLAEAGGGRARCLRG